MTDLSAILPGFHTQPYAHLLPSLEKNLVTTTDLLTLDAIDIAKRAKLPILDLQRLCNEVLLALQQGFEVGKVVEVGGATTVPLMKTGNELVGSWSTISTLDDTIDHALGGGIPTGYITEITGESGAGKTQFLLTLLLAAQLPEPLGLSRSALYISTESALPTTRLSQMLFSNPILSSATPKPSLDRIISIVTPDLESQDHILRYQLPVAIRRHKIGLVVLDSVAANYRAEFERPGAIRNGANMAKRSIELVKLGHLLRELARTENIAVVVANQVGDRFARSPAPRPTNSPLVSYTQSSPLAHRGPPAPNTTITAPWPSSADQPPGTSAPAAHLSLDPSSVVNSSEIMTLDHQQRWFTGWGDAPSQGAQKTPSLGLVWTAQIACRIALVKRPVYGAGVVADQETERGEPVLKRWRRWMRIVFAPWAASSAAGRNGGVEFEITGAGIRALGGATSGEGVGDVSAAVP